MSETAGSEPKPKTLLLATEVAFWRQQTGAQQRILGLVQYLSDQGWRVTVAYLGSWRSPKEKDQTAVTTDSDRIRQLNLNVVSLIDDWQPQGLLEQVTWQLKCVGNAVSSRLRAGSSRDSSAPVPTSQSRRLSDFSDAELQRRFEKLWIQLRPAIVIVEYITLSYLVPAWDRRAGIRFWVDTHDLLSSRCAQFQQRGLKHWVNVTEPEEAEALQKFDGIIAIEANEAEQFRRLTEHRVPVVVAGHAPAKIDSSANGLARQCTASDCDLTLGMIASDNAANIAGLEWFLQQVWPKLQSIHHQHRATSSIKLVLAGSVADNPIVSSFNSDNLIRLGRVEHLSDFYERIHIAINPIQIGTGLKIKSVEALSFGKPLIAHRYSLTGLPEAGQGTPFIAVDTADAMAAAIWNLANEPTRLQAMSAAALRYADESLTPDQVYGELLKQF